MPKEKKKKKGKGMKGMTIGGGHKRPTKQGGGMTQKVLMNIKEKILVVN